MNKEEVLSVLKVMKTYYPQSFNHNREGQEILINLWSKALEEEDGALVKKAVWDIINNDDREFAPNIAQVRKRMLMLSGAIEGTGILPVDEAWEMARLFWSSLGSDNVWVIEKDWNKLPSEIKRIYKPVDMVELGFHCTSAYIEQYEKPRFFKQYEAVAGESKAKVLASKSITQLALETRKAEIENAELGLIEG